MQRKTTAKLRIKGRWQETNGERVGENEGRKEPGVVLERVVVIRNAYRRVICIGGTGFPYCPHVSKLLVPRRSLGTRTLKLFSFSVTIFREPL